MNDMRMTGNRHSGELCTDYPARRDTPDAFQDSLNRSPDARAASFFKDTAEAEGNRRSINPNELMEKLDSYAPEGRHNLDSFIRLAGDLGMPRDAAVRAYQSLADQSGGEVTNELLMDVFSQFAGPSGNWNMSQFSYGLDALAQEGEPSDDQVASAFDSLSEGNTRITPDQLGNTLQGIARGKTFSAKEFADFGALLGFSKSESQATFDGLKKVMGRSPTVDDIMNFADMSADSKGNWNIRQFRDVVDRLDSVANGGTDPAMSFS
jgi:hypothetical protein